METVRTPTGPGGGLRSLEDLYREEYTGMVRLAFTLLGNNAEAEEIVQDSFVEVHLRMNRIRRPGAYLRTTVVSRCRTVLRRRAMAAARQPAVPDHLPDQANELWDVLGRLPEVQRTVVVLRHYGGYRSSEIAAMVGIAAPTVRSHVRRGLATLREELRS